MKAMRPKRRVYYRYLELPGGFYYPKKRIKR